jgi:hypothetical protein
MTALEKVKIWKEAEYSFYSESIQAFRAIDAQRELVNEGLNSV